MGKELQLVTPLHLQTNRDCLARMVDEKVHCMKIARQYEADYWDGDRRYGYGGYKYIPNRWRPVAEGLIKEYGLKNGSKVMDVGCGKGYLLYEMQLIEPGIEFYGIDISEHALANSKEEIRPFLKRHRAEDNFSFNDNEFDLVISLGTLHNLRLPQLELAIKEISRVGKKGYIMVESYRNEEELFNLECWALTAESLLSVDEWIWCFERFNYSGDYEFIYF